MEWVTIKETANIFFKENNWTNYSEQMTIDDDDEYDYYCIHIVMCNKNNSWEKVANNDQTTDLLDHNKRKGHPSIVDGYFDTCPIYITHIRDIIHKDVFHLNIHVYSTFNSH